MAATSYKENLARLTANLEPRQKGCVWLRTEREFQRLRDPCQIVTLPKLKFLEDAPDPDQTR